MTSDDLDTIKIMMAALNNKKRLQIVRLCSERPHSVRELSKKVGLDYSIVIEYTGMLEKAKLVKKERKEDNTVEVTSLVRINSEGEIKRI